MNNIAFNEAVESLIKHYGKYGVDRQTISGLLKSGTEEHGFSLIAAYNGIRMSLASTFGEHENFSIGDVMEITGESREEVVKRIEDMREEVAATGGNPDDYARDVTVTEEYGNGVTHGSLGDIEKVISQIVNISRDEGHDRRYQIDCAQNIFDQFGVPMEKRNLLKVIRARE